MSSLIVRRWLPRSKPQRDALEASDSFLLTVGAGVGSGQHDFATYLVNETGIPLTEARDVLGHASVVQTEVYVHKDESKLRAGMSMRASAISQQLGTKVVHAEVQVS